MAALSLENLLHWTAQVMVIGAVGLVLPLILRLRHPRTQLLYCHFLLAVCVLLPFVEPWRHPLLVIGGETLTPWPAAPMAVVAHTAGVAVPWNAIVLWILVAGAAARLSWLAAGLWQIRRYRISSTPLFPLPPAVEAAQALTGSEALVSISSSAPGPVTMGFAHPVVLVPESFQTLGEEAQCAVLCHEFLHVRRHDWLATVFEEIVGALLWFNPAIWWLVARTRLAREQVVDEEVVCLTSARDPYLDALLVIAGKRVEPDFAPAALFLRRRHLTQRVDYLLKDVSISRLRLLLSYASIAAVLALAGWFTLAALPLTGSAQVKEAEAPDQPGVRVDPGGTILHRVAVPYPPSASFHPIGGTVVAELTLRKNGEVADARIVSGPEELRAAVLWSVLQWHYATDGETEHTVRATVTFHAPAPRGHTPPDPDIEAALNSKEAHGVLARIDASALPEPIRSSVWERVKEFQGQPFSNYLMRQIEKAAFGVDSHMEFLWWNDRDGKDQTLTLFLGPRFLPPPPFDRFDFEPQTSSERAKQFPTNDKPRIVVGRGVMESKLVNRVEPVYPRQAEAAHVRGVVLLDVLIAPDGRVADVHLWQGDPALAQAAVDAVKQWTYKTTTIGGHPVEVVTLVRVPFGTE